MVSIRLSAHSPDGTQQLRTFRGDAYSQKQIQKIDLMYKQHIHSGKPKSAFTFPKPFELDMPEEKKEKSIKEHFPFRKIDCVKMPDNNCFSWLCIGSTRSGKSYAINYIYETYFKKHITFLMSLSAHHEIYQGFRKKAIICEGFKPQLIDEPMKINKLTKNHYDFLVITDDLALDGKNSTAMVKLLTIGRNSGMSFLGGIQKATMLNATGRTNCNMVLCFWLNTDTEIECLIKTFLRSYFPKDLSMPTMISMYRELTKDHHFIAYDSLAGECFHCKI
jgi:hypothetical protein